MECSICLEEITYNENFSITPCKHIFCFNCITKSLKKNQNCPCCRAELIKLDLDSDYDDLPDLIDDNDDSLEYLSENNLPQYNYITPRRYFNNFYRFGIINNNNILNIYESYNNQYTIDLSMFHINSNNNKLHIKEYFTENINMLNEQLLMFNEDRLN